MIWVEGVRKAIKQIVLNENEVFYLEELRRSIFVDDHIE